MKCENEKTYNMPGKCPICGMNLKKVGQENMKKAISEKVNITGSMRNVMHKGELFGAIDLDTISHKHHLYGLGPLEYLQGEILIIDGRSYVSRVGTNGAIQMEESYKVKAPFFVSENVTNWNEISLPDSVQSIAQLESYLEETTRNHSRPFAFKLMATIDNCEIHIVNLPEGIRVKSPEDAHKNQQTFKLKNDNVEIVGFFSTEHQGIFTHHDSYVHLHLITGDKMKMGHLDNIQIRMGTARLYLPKE